MSNAKSSRTTITELAAKKAAGQKWAMLTCYEQMSAAIFDQAGIPVLLVGDSAGNNFLGFENTIPVTVDELLPMARAVVNATSNAMVVADFPFGSYESSPDQALATGVRFFKEAKVGAVKLEGGAKVVPHIQKLIAAGIPVIGVLPILPPDYTANALFLTGGNATSQAASAAMAKDYFNATSVGIIHADNAGANSTAASLQGALDVAGIKWVAVKGGDNDTVRIEKVG